LLNKLFFIYVAKNEDWKQRYEEDWNYVSSMTRFFKWWIKHEFDIDITLEADILPIIPGKIFDRPSLAYLLKDHSERGNSVFHFYLPYFKPLWTDCRPLDGYHADNFGMVTWHRPKHLYSSSDENEKYFADNNCAQISHILSHEFLRRSDKKRKVYFDDIHKLWNLHLDGSEQFLYYNRHFKRVSQSGGYKYITIDLTKL
jgi:hypothetical protein